MEVSRRECAVFRVRLPWIWAQWYGVDEFTPQMRLLVQNDLGALETVQSVNTNQAAPTLFDDSKRVFGGPFPCDVAVRCAKCSGDALVHMKQQNVAERFILNVRHHKFSAAGCLCFLLGDCRETASQIVQHIQPQTEQATSRSGSSSAPRTNAAMATMMPTKILVPFQMALSDFIVDYRPFTKTKGLHQVSVLNT